MLHTITPQGMRTLENAAFAAGVSSLLLMEKAAQCVLDVLKLMLKGDCAGKTVLFACGAGNNGGDGLAAARLFSQQGGKPLICMPAEAQTPDAQTNYRYAKAIGLPFIAPCAPLPPCDAIVDALFGTGFHGAVEADSPFGTLIRRLNGHAPILAVDVPSGMDALTGAAAGVCVHAARTITFHRPKIGLYLSDKRPCVGKMMVADIGLNRLEALCCETGIPVAMPGDLAALLPKRAIDAHKGDCGRVLMYAGSVGMAGAAIVAAEAALRAGAGLVTLLCAPELMPILQTAVPSAMCSTVPTRFDVLLMGCGLAETPSTWTQIRALHGEKQLEVWDAGALALLAGQPFVLGKNVVITPHVGEAARLLGWDASRVTGDMIAAAKALQERFGCSVLLKSSVSVLLSAEGELALNAVGSPALAKGGSGDMLAGLLAALLAQGFPVFQAMQCACLWHGMAARHAAQTHGIRGTLTGDILRAMGKLEPAEFTADEMHTDEAVSTRTEGEFSVAVHA